MNILAIDASTRSSGWAIYKDEKMIDCGCITASSTDLVARIKKIISDFDSVLQEHSIEVIILEEVRPGDAEERGIAHPVKNTTYKALMYLQAAITFLVHEKYKKIKIEYVYPSEWRKVCGIHTGRGIKRQELKEKSIEFAFNKYGVKVNDDIADAIGIGYYYTHKEKAEKQEVFEW